jgi:virulence factor Mce-like protein
VVAAVLALGYIGVRVLSGGDQPQYSAEFADASGLLTGNDVRVGGAIVGRVRSISLTRQGTASVRFTLASGAATPRADAVAAIRPVDLLGDNYLSLSPGASRARLRGPIPTARTSNAPRLDDVLRAFRPQVRDGLQALFVEGGLALDRRGADLARAAVILRPAFAAADSVARELGGQNARLGPLVVDAERAAAQLASRERDLGPLVDGLAGTLRATASEAPSLDRGVAGLPSLLSRARSLAMLLGDTADAAIPVARSLRASAAPLGDALAAAPPLLDAAGHTAARLGPAVRSARSLLIAADPALRRLRTALPALRAIAPDADRFLSAFDAAAPAIGDGFFVNFPDQAAEPGNQPFDPFADPRRAYWRGAAVLSCEAFGVPVAPGCLDHVLANQRDSRRAASHRRAAAPSPASPVNPGTSATPTTSSPTPSPPTLAPPASPGDVADQAVAALDFLLGP